MGIDIRAGFLADQLAFDYEAVDWFREELERINGVLVARGYPPHVEPETLPPIERRACVGTAREWGWRLKRAYACLRDRVPMRTGEYTEEDGDLVTEASASYLDSHIIIHQTDGGFYAPIDFPRGPLFDDDLPGLGLLGSTQGLLRELVELAPALGLTLANGELTPAALALLGSDLNEHPLGGELLIWHQYYEESRISLAYGSLIVVG